MDPQQTEEDSLPVTVDALAAAVLLVYTDAEQALIIRSAALVRDALAAGPGSVQWMSLYADLRREADRTTATVRSQARAMAASVADTAARNGNTAAARELSGYQPENVLPLLPHDVNSARLLAADLDHRLTAAASRIARFADDAYRAATVSAAVEQILPAKATPLEAQAQAWRQLVSRGVTGFTDKAGREWNLSTYVEMAVRTATQRAYNASHRDRLTQAGIEYFTISTTGRPCGLCAPWEGKVLADRGAGEVTEPHAGKDGTVTFTVAATIEEATAAGLFHPNCFPGFVPVSSPSGVRAADSRWYEGDVVIVKTASGNELTVTPNHPVLTPQGWVAAGELMVGGNVLSYGGDVESVDTVRPDDELVPTPISDVFNALTESGAVLSMSVPSSPEQFHGDGEGSDVKVVLSGRLLEDNGIDTETLEGLRDLSLFGGGVGLTDLFGTGSLDEVGLDPAHAPDGVMGGGWDEGTLCRRHALIAALRRLGLGDVRATGNEPTADGGLTDSEGGRDLALSLTGKVTLDSIVNIRRESFSGHVYNLQSGDGWYVASSIVVHNCKHTLTAYLPGVTKLRTNNWSAADELAYRTTQTLRALERDVRAAKLAAEAALTPLDKARAMRDVRAGQASIRDFTARTGLLRRRHREQLNNGLSP